MGVVEFRGDVPKHLGHAALSSSSGVAGDVYIRRLADGDDAIISTDINDSGPDSPYQVINNACDGGNGNDFGGAGCAAAVSIP